MAHKALISVVGPSGTGKSTSLRNLDPATTRILDLERKGFPFRGSDKFTILPCNNPAEATQALEKCIADKTVKLIIIESLTKLFEMQLKLAQSAFKGYEVYAAYNKSIGNFLEMCKNDHAVVVFTAIDEIVKVPMVDGSEQSQRRIWVQGKQWEGKIEKEMLMVLFTDVKKDKDNPGAMKYLFQTNTDGTTSSKSPMGMFPTQLVDNDLKKVLDEALKYYEGDKDKPTA